MWLRDLIQTPIDRLRISSGILMIKNVLHVMSHQEYHRLAHNGNKITLATAQSANHKLIMCVLILIYEWQRNERAFAMY